MKNAQYTTKDIKEIGEKKLEINFRRSGKEYNGWFLLKGGKKAKRLTVPKGRKNVCRKLYSSMAKQLGLTVPLFDDLLECPLTKEKYETIIS